MISSPPTITSGNSFAVSRNHDVTPAPPLAPSDPSQPLPIPRLTDEELEFVNQVMAPCALRFSGYNWNEAQAKATSEPNAMGQPG